ncbi:MAG: hypothetical protein IPL65_06560 [Lewinellaceae bacterium]|nr:hypothetical protein [Lewinellaceae bacterium]
MKHPIFSISLIAFVFVLTSFAPPAKFKYTSTEGNFSITFPADYETANKDTEDFTSVETQSSFEDQLYFVSCSTHKMEISEHESLAATSLESFNEAMGGRITQQSTWSIKKHKGLQADIEIPSDNIRAKYRVVLIGQFQYQVVVMSESSKWNQVNADKFINSFKLKK